MAFNPFFFNDSPLPLELIHKALTELNYINKNVLPTVDELKDKVDQLIADLDGAIKDEVQRVINDMYESGELAEILESIIDERLSQAFAPKEFMIDTRREFRVALRAQNYNSTTFNDEIYSYCQGGNMFMRQGVQYYIGCYKVSWGNNTYYKNDNADIRLYMYLGGRWQFVKNQVYSVGHANDIRYIPELDKFFVVEGSVYNQTATETGSKQIIVIDWDLPAQPTAEFTINGFYPNRDRITCIDYFDGKYWAFIGSGGDSPVQIYTFTLTDNYVVENLETYDVFYVPYHAETPYTMICAGVCQNEDYIFMGNTAPAGIYRYNKHTKKLDCFYNIGDTTNNSMCMTGEIENLSLIDNIIYISTSIHSNQTVNYWDYNQVFSFDYVNGLAVPNKVFTSYGGSTRVISVGNPNSDTNIDAAVREISNPNGLTGDYGLPFQTWGEAFLFINAQHTWKDITIRPITRNLIEYCVINCPDKSIFIDGTTFYNNHPNDSYTQRFCHIGGLFVEGGHLTVEYMWIENRVPSGVVSSGYADNEIYCRLSIATFNRCLFRQLSRPTTILMSLNRSFVNIGATMLYSNGDDTAIDLDGTNISTYISTVNTHGKWTGASNSNIVG